MMRRPRWPGPGLTLKTALFLVLLRGIAGAQEAAPSPAAPKAPPVSASPDPTSIPPGADSTGGTYTGANMTAALTGTKDEKTGQIAVDRSTMAADIKLTKTAINVAWTLITGFLVMFMQAGFALVECGLTRAKNAAHTMGMNFVIYPLGMIGFWICGFALMAGGWGPVVAMDGPNVLDSMLSIRWGDKTFDLLGWKGAFLGNSVNDATVLTLFLFQMVFMDTAATIPTGAMAERWKFSAFVVFGFFLSMVIYPVFGCWVWGGGWLADLGVLFGLGNGHVDFAGSSVVHMTGGVTALAGVIILGPRIGKFNEDGSANAIPGHNIPMTALGTLILAFGWFGFNPGSSLAATDLRIGSIAVCTMLATATGCLAALFYTWVFNGKPDLTMSCNGLLAGAVAITAPCAFVNPIGAAIIGACAGVLVVWSVLFVERVLKVDDPVGAISVHGVCGAFGCLCIGLFATGEYGKGWNGVADKAPTGIFYGGWSSLGQLAAQSIGVLTNFLWVFSTALGFFWVVEKTMGNRVEARVEIQGLDLPEVGVLAYVEEDNLAVKNAERNHIDRFGPGVPRGRWWGPASRRTRK